MVIPPAPWVDYVRASLAVYCLLNIPDLTIHLPQTGLAMCGVYSS
jgi:hypothetical protein